GAQVRADPGATARGRKHVLLRCCFFEHVDEVRAGTRALAILHGFAQLDGSVAADVEPIILAVSAVPCVAAPADFSEIVKPQLKLRRVLRNDEVPWYGGERGNHAALERLFHQAGMSYLSARVDADEALDVPHFGAAPVSFTAADPAGVEL